MKTLWQDIRFGLRILARNPGFTGASVLILALALGANTAVFSVMNGVLLRALPFPEPDRIVAASVLMPPGEGRPGHRGLLDSRELESWRASARTVEQVAAHRTWSFTLSGPAGAERLTGASVSPALFPLLRVAPVLGRTFLDEEQQPGRDRVVLLSFGLWQRRFRGDPRIAGRTVTLDGVPYTVVGVMPGSFFFPRQEVQLWAPLAVAPPAPEGAGRIDLWYDPVVARLKDGMSLEQAAAEAQAVLDSTGSGTPGGAGTPSRGRVQLVPLRDEMVAEVRPALLVMMASVGLVLLVACLDLAHLLLARNSARQREMAIRSAVGGGRARLVRQMLTESTVLALAGGAAGMLLAGWIHRLLPPLLPRDLPRIEEVQLDARVFLFAFLLASVTGLAFGLLPALRGAGTDPGGLRHATMAGASPSPRSRGLLLVTQVALAFVLLVGAGLLLRSFLRLVAVDPGYEPDQVLAATLALDPVRYGAPGRSEALFDELLRRLEERAEVVAAGAVSFPPLASDFSLTSLEVVGEPPAPSLAIPQATSPGYLRAMGLRLAAGRWLTAQDHARRAPVAVVNETFARRYVTGGQALGRQVKMGAAALEIVGVVKDVHLLGVAQAPKPELFTSYYHTAALSGTGPQRLTLVARTSGDPAALAPVLRSLVREADPDLALERVEPMRARLAASVARPRFYALLLSVFACMALALASAGIYGVLSYTVARQTRAIGVRRALGARGRDLAAMVFQQGGIPVAAGLAIGMVVAAGATRVVGHLLFGVTTRDPLSYGVAAFALASVAVLACYLPARRAAHVEPIAALRHED